MITSIPEGQMCQAFDPMMFLPEKTLHIIDVTQNANTSCVAPAFVYIEGSHGKKFLCDFHYYYEVNMTRDSGYRARGESWQDIQQYIVDEREKIKETFAKDVTTKITLGKKCHIGNRSSLKCDAEAFVLVTRKSQNFKGGGSTLYCNYHFRKNYYRFYSNGVVYEDLHDILDERYRMTMTIAEESLNIKAV
jgi:hypothetical protein